MNGAHGNLGSAAAEEKMAAAFVGQNQLLRLEETSPSQNKCRRTAEQQCTTNTAAGGKLAQHTEGNVKHLQGT